MNLKTPESKRILSGSSLLNDAEKILHSGKKSSNPAKAEKGIGKAKASTWQCVNHQRQRGRNSSQVVSRERAVLVPLYTAGCDPWTKIPKGKLKEKASLLFLSQSVLLLSILGNCSSVSFLSTCWQPAPINTYSCFLVFLSLLFFILNPSFSQIRVSGSKKITITRAEMF